MGKVYLSKSKYCGFWQCPKMAWLNKYKLEEKTEDPGQEAVFTTGNEVGDLAMGLFGDFVEVTEYSAEKIDIGKMIENTKKELDRGTEVICEASFSFDGLYCAVDILKKEGKGYAIYEVKSSSIDPEKPEINSVYVADIAFQKYVLEHCGITVTGTNLVCINNSYVRGEKLDINELFCIVNVDDLVNDEIRQVGPNLKLAEKILGSDTEPDYDLDMRCHNPYKCAFWDYCTRNLPKPSVFDLYRMNFDIKLELYHAGLIKYEDLKKSGKIKNPKQKRQIEYVL